MADRSLADVLATAAQPVVAPCVYDCASALAAQQVGFSALMLSGGEVSMAMNGTAVDGLNSLTEIEWVTSRITAVIDIPLAVDMDDGFGGPEAVYRTTQRLIAAGAAALQLEDAAPWASADLLPREQYYAKVRAALAAAEGTNCLIIARTNADPRTELAEGITRCQEAYALGAHLTTVVRLNNRDDARLVGSSVPGWKMYPDIEGRNGTPEITTTELAEFGFSFATMHYLLKAAMAGMLEHGRHNVASQSPLYTCDQADDTRIPGALANPLFPGPRLAEVNP